MLSPSKTTCLYDFTVRVNENQNDATFIALGIYLKLSNTKNQLCSSRQQLFTSSLAVP